MTKLLLVEDDTSLGESLQDFLVQEGMNVDWTQSTKGAQSKVLDNDYDVIILDWMLPDGHGIDLLKRWHEEKRTVPVIMLTARTDLLDKVIGLESGANDYITKPFETRELVARIRVQLRAQNTELEGETEIIRKDLVINVTTREVFYQEKSVYLTKMEFDLLRLLSEKPGRPYTRDELLNKVWGFEFTPSTRTVDTHVLQLRQKLNEDMFETVRGVGYRFSKKFSLE
jgi:DNA-binding response OmpR family regulator